jgi:hypothetical protein
MLEGMEAERGQRPGAAVAENAEDAAFLMQPVVRFERTLNRHCHRYLRSGNASIDP